MLRLILLVLVILVLAAILGLTVHPLFWLLVGVAIALAVTGRSRL